MKQDITVPEVGESVSSGVLAGWLKQNGDTVSEGEDLFELETDKATLSVPAPASGVLEIAVEEDSEVAVGQSVGSIDTAGARADAAAAAKADGGAGAKPESAAGGEDSPAGGEAARDQASAAAEESPAGGEAARDQASPAGGDTGSAGGKQAAAGRMPAGSLDDLPPAARRVAAEHNLDVRAIQGTGKDGRITKEDALRAVDEQKALGTGQKATEGGTNAGPTSKAESGSAGAGRAGNGSDTTAAPPSGSAASAGSAQGSGENDAQTRKKLTSLRKRVAANLVTSKQNAAHLTTFNEVDMSKVMEIRSTHKEQFEKKHEIKLGIMSFFVKAGQRALEAYPEVNAFLEEDEIVYNHFYNIGVALSTERGLMTPVIRNVESKGFADIERQIMSFIERAKGKKLMPDELTGGTFTISNGGVFGSMLSTPIPNPPQTAVLGMHTIEKRPVVVDDEVVVRPMMYLALSYDHRMIDGREAIGFLNTIKGCIEDPARILLDL